MTVPLPGPPRPADPRGAVSTAMSALETLAERPPAEHVAAYERIHTALGDALAAGSDTRPA